MKKFLIITLLLLTFSFSAYAQKVEVDQSFVNDATKAFNEVVELRVAVKELQADKKISERQAAHLNKQIADLEENHNQTVEEHKKEVSALRKLIEKLNKRQISIFFGLIKFRF
jgi:anion-transporting  ArsA/GET3 family ATPase